MAHHDHRNARLGTSVLINASWDYSAFIDDANAAIVFVVSVIRYAQQVTSFKALAARSPNSLSM